MKQPNSKKVATYLHLSELLWAVDGTTACNGPAHSAPPGSSGRTTCTDEVISTICVVPNSC